MFWPKLWRCFWIAYICARFHSRWKRKPLLSTRPPTNLGFIYWQWWIRLVYVTDQYFKFHSITSSKKNCTPHGYIKSFGQKSLLPSYTQVSSGRCVCIYTATKQQLQETIYIQTQTSRSSSLPVGARNISLIVPFLLSLSLIYPFSDLKDRPQHTSAPAKIDNRWVGEEAKSEKKRGRIHTSMPRERYIERRSSLCPEHLRRPEERRGHSDLAQSRPSFRPSTTGNDTHTYTHIDAAGADQ